MRIAQSLRLEKIPAAAGQLFVLKRFRPAFFSFNWHYHPEVELTLIRRGRGVRYVGGSVERYEEGDFCLLGANLPHSWSSQREDGRVESTVIQFLPQAAGASFWGLRELREIDRLLRGAGAGWSIGGRMHVRGVALLDALEKLPLLSPRRAALFLELLAGLAEAKAKTGERGLRPLHPGAPPRPAVRRGRSEKLLQAILGHVEAHSGREIVHAEAARLVRLSPAAFCRFFKRHMGKTFGEHVNEVRLARVCGELADTDRGITEIAFACGYGNLPHFNRRFRMAMGCTPREYRRRTLPFPADRVPGGLDESGLPIERIRRK